MRLIETDFGTPEVPLNGGGRVSLEVDGVAVEVPAGTSILRAATQAGVSIPRLCATDSLKAYGSCRLCMVEVEGRDGFKSSCTEPVREGMQVRTQTPT